MKSLTLQEMFKKFKVLTLDHVSKTQTCSIRTIQRQFADLDVLRSYNKNSRYYTLPSIPQFNSHGIWCYQDILFSKYGDLRKTVKHLILNSECGLSGNEIGDIVNLLPRSFMHHFREMEGIFREKHGGVYVYFSNDANRFEMQNVKRFQATDIQKISDTIVVKILVEYIKHPEFSAEELSIRLKQEKNCDVSATAINNLFSFHGLLKKTLDHWR